MTAALVWPIVVPLTGATASLFTGRRGRLPVALTASAATLAASAYAVLAVWTHGELRHPVGGWGRRSASTWSPTA
jgi:formate hydrogenlyase subunit 3/multisubunit Na+/H+ antiporter MnhD subunit